MATRIGRSPLVFVKKEARFYMTLDIMFAALSESVKPDLERRWQLQGVRVRKVWSPSW
jgi:hypothetical protein